MENTNNTNKTLNSFEGWAERVQDLNNFIKEMGETTAETFINSGVRKAGKAQALAVLCHCSSGYIGDKFRNKTTLNENLEVLAEIIAPALTPEQVKERNKETAKSALATLKEQGVPVDTIKLVISAMPCGKEVLAESGI
jgi:hypothetical protein